MTRWIIALALGLALPATAQASSIVYTKGGDVWISDMATGTGHRVTTDGTPSNPYRSPSQSDDGTIVALRGTRTDARLHRFDQAGNELNAPVETAAPGSGPLEPQVSPDGTRVGYHYAATVNGCAPYYTCPSAATSIQYTAADRFTDPARYGDPGRFADVSWIDDRRTLVFSNSAWIHDVGTDNVRSWISATNAASDDAVNRNIQDGEVSRDGRRVAVVLSHYEDGSGYIQLYRANGDFVNEPPKTCAIRGADGGFSRFTDPTWSPDGSQLAWAEPDGIYVAKIDDAPCNVTIVSRIDGQEPDWGPAAVSTSPGADPAPVLTGLRVRAGSIRWSLSELAALVLTFQRKTGGRWVRVPGKVETVGDSGPNSLRWDGRVGGRKLRKGTYRVTGVAIDLAEQRSTRVRVTFVRR